MDMIKEDDLDAAERERITATKEVRGYENDFHPSVSTTPRCLPLVDATNGTSCATTAPSPRPVPTHNGGSERHRRRCTPPA